MAKKSFNRAAGDSVRPRDRRNTPGKMNSASVLTRNRLDKLALVEPKEPALELGFDMDGIRAASNAQARGKHRDMIESLRARLRSKSADGRKEFRQQARSERGGREREICAMQLMDVIMKIYKRRNSRAERWVDAKRLASGSDPPM